MIPTNVTYHIVLCKNGNKTILDSNNDRYDARPFVKCRGGYLEVQVTDGTQTTLIGHADIPTSWVPPHADPDAVMVAEDIVVKNVMDDSSLCSFQPDKDGWFLLLKDKHLIKKAIAAVPWVAKMIEETKLQRVDNLIQRASSIKNNIEQVIYDLQNNVRDPDLIWQAFVFDIYKEI